MDDLRPEFTPQPSESPAITFSPKVRELQYEINRLNGEIMHLEDHIEGVEDERNLYLAWFEANDIDVIDVTREARAYLAEIDDDYTDEDEFLDRADYEYEDRRDSKEIE